MPCLLFQLKNPSVISLILSLNSRNVKRAKVGVLSFVRNDRDSTILRLSWVLVNTWMRGQIVYLDSDSTILRLSWVGALC